MELIHTKAFIVTSILSNHTVIKTVAFTLLCGALKAPDGYGTVGISLPERVQQLAHRYKFTYS